MKKLLIILLSALSLTAFAQQKIALLEPRAGEGSTTISGMEKAMVRGELRKAIVNQPGYEAFTRADIDQLMKEQDFQRTGNVSEADIHKMGEMSGADYICVSTLTKSNTEFYLEAYLIHLESGRMSNPASQYGELTDGKLANMLPVCEALARELLDGAIQRSNKETKSQQSHAEKTDTNNKGKKVAQSGTAKIIIFRPFSSSGWSNMSATHVLFIDGQWFGNIPTTIYYEIVVEPGKHTIDGYIGNANPEELRCTGSAYSITIDATKDNVYYASVDDKKKTIYLVPRETYEKNLNHKHVPLKWAGKAELRGDVFYDMNGNPVGENASKAKD